MTPKVDLHSHTTCSDRRDAPAELARKARAAGIDVLAVTDHDTVDGIAPAAEEGKRIGLRVVPGLEMSSQFEGRDVHVLGIGIDPFHPALVEQLEDMRRARRVRVGLICEALAKQGIVLDPGDVLAEAGGKSVGRKHVARALVKGKLVPDEATAFEWFLKDGAPAHIPSTEIPPATAASFIRGAGGLPVLAHPHFFEDDGLVKRILDSTRFAAIEAYHRYEKPGRHVAFLAMARERHLLVTGGSDYHGDDHPHNAGMGEYLTPLDQWEALRRRLQL
ncbi:MAG TPA: PHP domain-containing protein [Planctomycetota bacterium]|nr:PHP domain-containing protein [Planctomycetota bacterium]